MFEPRPLALAGGIGVIDMELLSVSRRWYYRDHFSIREISDIDALGCRGTWSASTCVRTASNRSLPSQIGRAGWTHTPTSCRICCGRRRGSRESRSGPSGNSTLI
jgi:hypothetical protein